MNHLSVYPAKNVLIQNTTHHNYQNFYIYEKWGAILRGLWYNITQKVIQAQHISLGITLPTLKSLNFEIPMYIKISKYKNDSIVILKLYRNEQFQAKSVIVLALHGMYIQIVTSILCDLMGSHPGTV